MSENNKWVLGDIAKNHESGAGGSATLSNGQGDHGGVSYGTFQFSSTLGNVQQFVKKYYKQ